MALLEAITALVVLAVGLLGMIAAQTRLVADSRNSAQRAVAVGLIEDLSGRLMINREAAFTGQYDMAWGAPPAAVNCTNSPCNAAQRAGVDLNQWLQTIQSSLPGGTGMVFRSPSDPRQIGIVVSWVAREGGSSAAERAQRLALLSTGFLNNSSGITCPSGNYCQLVYVQP
jgi:type IV pilus assembly protein PilV